MRIYRTARGAAMYIRREAQRRGRPCAIISHDEGCALFDESGLYEPQCDCRPRKEFVRVARPARR